MGKKLGKCTDCGRKMVLMGRGLCSGCYHRHKRSGTLDEKFPLNAPPTLESQTRANGGEVMDELDSGPSAAIEDPQREAKFQEILDEVDRGLKERKEPVVTRHVEGFVEVPAGDAEAEAMLRGFGGKVPQVGDGWELVKTPGAGREVDNPDRIEGGDIDPGLVQEVAKVLEKVNLPEPSSGDHLICREEWLWHRLKDLSGALDRKTHNLAGCGAEVVERCRDLAMEYRRTLDDFAGEEDWRI
ncbi:MAG: hypothetical protein GX751_12240 [Desulfuromonadaceae bacterium]|nr:hypothetical protein [Desulfuromonadaceae bacterium]